MVKKTDNTVSEENNNNKLSKKEKAEIYIGPTVSSIVSGLTTGLIIGVFTLIWTFNDSKRLADLNNSFQKELISRSEETQKKYHNEESLSKLNDEIMTQAMTLNKSFIKNMYIRDNGTVGFKDAAEQGTDFVFATENLNDYKIEKLRFELLLNKKNKTYKEIEKELKNMDYFLVINNDKSLTYSGLEVKIKELERDIESETDDKKRKELGAELVKVESEYEEKKEEKDSMIKSGGGIKLETLRQYIENNQF